MTRNPTSAAPQLEVRDLVRRYESLLEKGNSDDTVVQVLRTRDRLAKAICRVDAISRDDLDRINALDKRMPKVIEASGERKNLKRYRAVFHPPTRNWWWYEDENSSALWPIGSAILFVISATLLGDLIRRVLTSDPDNLGMLTVAFPAVLTFAAGSTFTSFGRKSLSSILSHRGIPSYNQPRSLLLIAFVFFLAAAFIWKKTPHHLAEIYVAKGYKSSGFEATRFYDRAIALDPTYNVPHVNLGDLYAQSYDYASATAEYRKALVVGDRTGFNDLARMYSQDKKPELALQIANDALQLPAPPNEKPSVRAALLENKASAEYDLGFFPEAEKDVRESLRQDSTEAPTYCILAKALDAQMRHAEAKQFWSLFYSHGNADCSPNAYSSTESQPAAPECLILARRALHEK